MPPKLTLRFYDGAIVAARKVGRRWSEYFVDAGAVRQVLAGAPTSSGLLGPNTLATGLREGVAFTVALIAPRRVLVAIGTKTTHEFAFVTPPIVWAGWGEQYRIFALHTSDLAKGWPTSDRITLYHAPFANTYASGAICWGSGRRPGVASPATMEAGFTIYAEDSFFIASAMSAPSAKYGGDLDKLYAALRGLKVYPSADLTPQGKQLSDVLSAEVFSDSL